MSKRRYQMQDTGREDRDKERQIFFFVIFCIYNICKFLELTTLFSVSGKVFEILDTRCFRISIEYWEVSSFIFNTVSLF